MAICKAVILDHSGRIGVDSEEGKGSTFWIRLRSAPPQAKQVTLRESTLS
ncbi:MAG: hypothetical protein ACRD3W_24060 [Terriglobales bacterium]